MRTHTPRILLFEITFHTGTLGTRSSVTYRKHEMDATALDNRELFHRNFRVDLCFDDSASDDEDVGKPTSKSAPSSPIDSTPSLLLEEEQCISNSKFSCQRCQECAYSGHESKVASPPIDTLDHYPSRSRSVPERSSVMPNGSERVCPRCHQNHHVTSSSSSSSTRQHASASAPSSSSSRSTSRIPCTPLHETKMSFSPSRDDGLSPLVDDDSQPDTIGRQISEDEAMAIALQESYDNEAARYSENSQEHHHHDDLHQQHHDDEDEESDGSSQHVIGHSVESDDVERLLMSVVEHAENDQNSDDNSGEHAGNAKNNIILVLTKCSCCFCYSVIFIIIIIIIIIIIEFLGCLIHYYVVWCVCVCVCWKQK